MRAEAARAGRVRWLGRLLAATALTWMACHPQGARFPWSGEVGAARVEHAEVRTVSRGYDRRHSQVLVREVQRPTRANLDYAAYHANFTLAEAAPEGGDPVATAVDTQRPFGGLLERASFTPDLARTGLTAAERSHPLSFAPLSEFLLARKLPGADRIEALGAAVRAESWGQRATPGVASQSVSELFVHRRANAAELWVKIEFAPWFRLLGTLPDQDRDGYPELYARANGALLTPALLAAIDDDYAGRELDAAAIRGWANQLASYWYPSFNTDLVPPGPRWPDGTTEREITAELGGASFAAPAVILRSKPEGRASYAVLLLSGGSKAGPAQGAAAAALQLPRTAPSPAPSALAASLAQELAEAGDSWDGWVRGLAPFHAAVRKRRSATPRGIQAVAGEDGFLFYRKGLEYVTARELTRQVRGKNPLPIIVEYQQALAALGVDFLFVPVPDKLEIYPDAFDPRFAQLAGRVVAPWTRKLLLDLSARGVECVDLLPALLRERGKPDSAGQEPLFQHQDTHWTARGLELAAGLIAERIKRYPWYPALARSGRPLHSGTASFTRFGDLHARLPEALKTRYRPETLEAHPVFDAAGQAYDDDPDSPIVVLGDSFTGVYELTDAEHAGVSAHIARGISYPVDLVMSYGGGPNVRNKLMRRGTDALANKRLVIWLMAARDLHDYWEPWEPLKAP